MCLIEDVGIKDFRSSDVDYSVAGNFSDGVDIERCFISSHLVESFLGMSPSACTRALNAENDKFKRKLLKKEICYRFLKFKGLCDVIAAPKSAEGSPQVLYQYTIINYSPDA